MSDVEYCKMLKRRVKHSLSNEGKALMASAIIVCAGTQNTSVGVIYDVLL